MRWSLRLFFLVGAVVLLVGGAFASSHRQDETAIKLSLAPGDTYIPVSGDPVTNNQDTTQYMEFTVANGDRIESGTGVVRSVLLMNDGQDVEIMANTKCQIHDHSLKLTAGVVEVQNDTNGPDMGPYDFNSYESPAHPSDVKVHVQTDGSGVEILGGHAKVAYFPSQSPTGPFLDLRTGDTHFTGSLASLNNHVGPGEYRLGEGGYRHRTHRVARSHRHRHRHHYHAGGPAVHIGAPHPSASSGRTTVGTTPSVSISVHPSGDLRTTPR